MRYRFDAFEIDTARAELRGGGCRRRVEPRVFELLCYLIENRDRVVDCVELHETLWRDRVVGNAALSRAVKLARRAVDDDGRAQRLIRTVHGRGFRFVGEVTAREELSRQSLTLRASPLLDAVRRGKVSRTRTARPLLAVSRFAALDGTGDGGELAEGLRRDLVARLGCTCWLDVLAHRSAFRVGGVARDSARLGTKLGVRYVLRGSLERVGRRLRFEAVLQAATGAAELWSASFTRPIGDPRALRHEISEALAADVSREIGVAERERVRSLRPERLHARETYHLACWHLSRFTPEALSRATALLERSIELEPQLSAPYAVLSFLYWRHAVRESGADRVRALTKAVDLARRAVALDPDDEQGHRALGRALWLADELGRSVAGPAVSEGRVPVSATS